jgi:hypothetical protein
MPEVFNSLTINITNAVGDGNTVTYSTSNSHNFIPGMFVTISNTNPSSFSIKKYVIDSVPSNTTFTVSSEVTASYVSGGIATSSYYNKFSGVKFNLNTKTPPFLDSTEPLYDISTGLTLTDVNDATLYTEERVPYAKGFYSKTANPVVFSIDETNPIRVEEQFRESTPVSTTLLGVDRGEVQLGLFSDVSVYGMDRNNWEYFQWTEGTPQPPEWFNRRNPKYGPRYSPKLVEVAEEQALSLDMFPVNYSFPYGPKFQDNGYYLENLYPNFRRFIALGNYLYNYYFSKGDFENQKFAIEHFLPSTMVSDSADITYGFDEYTTSNNMDQIEKWTLAWMEMRDNTDRKSVV